MSKVAAIQMCSSDLVDENLNDAAALIEQAADQGALLAVLPEMFALFGQDEFAKIRIGETPGSGKIQDFLAELALRFKIWIVGGTIPMQCQNPEKVRASCIVFNHDGQQVARYDKSNLFDVTISTQEIYSESDSTEPGNQLAVVDTPVGKLGLCVCFDLRFPSLFTQLSAQGVELIAAPSAFTLKTGAAHWELLMRSRAIDTLSYVIGACQGGIHANGRKTYGHSMIVNPWGEVVGEVMVPGQGMACADIDLERLYAIRKMIPVLK